MEDKDRENTKRFYKAQEAREKARLAAAKQEKQEAKFRSKIP